MKLIKQAEIDDEEEEEILKALELSSLEELKQVLIMTDSDGEKEEGKEGEEKTVQLDTSEAEKQSDMFDDVFELLSMECAKFSPLKVIIKKCIHRLLYKIMNILK